MILTEILKQFDDIYRRAHNSGRLAEPTAMSLATVDKTGQPSVRIVLLKDFDENGFVFFTNKKSRKAEDISQNPKAALCFFWDPLEDQIRIEGTMKDVADSEADDYWSTRPRESQIGAWASHQSAEAESLDALKARYKEVEEKYKDQEIPRPPYWSGYRLVPHRFEFWKRRPYRLHDRIVYLKSDHGWRKTFLFP